MEKLYIVVRKDLAPGMQIAQSCHALMEFVEHNPELTQQWHTEHRNIVILNIPSLPELIELHKEAKLRSIPCSEFNEPDLNSEMTALALAQNGGSLVSSLPLALRRTPRRAA